MNIFYFFRWAFLATFIGLLLGGWLGWLFVGTWAGIASFFFICFVLSLLEISLSFDNSIINAGILKTMTPIWQKRFLSYGILIAVFGMRIVFPLLIIVIATKLNPIEAVKFALWYPQDYARIIAESQLAISAFGGTFLMMVGLKYFFDPQKTIHWLGWIEKLAHKASAIPMISSLITLCFILIFCAFLEEKTAYVFLLSATYGLLVFLAVETISIVLNQKQQPAKHHGNTLQKGGAAAFLYLEMIDASFSFDGVIGAFALSSNLFIIALGLGIGAFYVRSITIMLVENKTLGHYRYLEHGAFYAILLLAGTMYFQTIIHISEIFTGLIGVFFILAAFLCSLYYNQHHPESQAS